MNDSIKKELDIAELALRIHLASSRLHYCLKGFSNKKLKFCETWTKYYV